MSLKGQIWENIQLMTFDKVDTMIYQPRRSDNYQGKWPWWLSLLEFINIVSVDIKSTIILLNGLIG